MAALNYHQLTMRTQDQESRILALEKSNDDTSQLLGETRELLGSALRYWQKAQEREKNAKKRTKRLEKQVEALMNGVVPTPRISESPSGDGSAYPNKNDGVESHDEDSDLPNPGEYPSSEAESCDDMALDESQTQLEIEVYDGDDRSSGIVEAQPYV